jgi:anti-sigma B factor antagonist
VSLSFQSRRVGDITVVKCSGRIVEGAESAGLQQQLNDLIAENPYIILNLGEVDFIDSSGIGLLLRFLTRAQNAHGNLKLCAVSSKVSDVLRVTNLKSVLESYGSEADAVADFYRRAKSPSGSSLRANIVCVEKSPDVLAYVRELLRQAGYDVVTTGNLADALTLLTATRPKLVVVGAEFRSMRDTRAAETFNRLADALAVVELPADFSRNDAGEAGRQLLDHVRALIGAPPGPAAV